MSYLPKLYKQFLEKYPEIARAYENLGNAVHQSGPLDEKTRALVKLGLATGAHLEGAVHSHVRKALDAGCTADEIRQVVLLALPTVGFPSTMAAMSWVADVLQKETKKKK
ncbi:MAG: carboxymuconolactone decarboxylase family protein [Deltaproteobacteria bacterium]|nr:carboxymuconolactone decarboxylase family protein [Deltaproteobacteria bacterium]